MPADAKGRQENIRRAFMNAARPAPGALDQDRTKAGGATIPTTADISPIPGKLRRSGRSIEAAASTTILRDHWSAVRVGTKPDRRRAIRFAQQAGHFY
jgi:hypothetical protein